MWYVVRFVKEGIMLLVVWYCRLDKFLKDVGLVFYNLVLFDVFFWGDEMLESCWVSLDVNWNFLGMGVSVWKSWVLVM